MSSAFRKIDKLSWLDPGFEHFCYKCLYFSQLVWQNSKILDIPKFDITDPKLHRNPVRIYECSKPMPTTFSFPLDTPKLSIQYLFDSWVKSKNLLKLLTKVTFQHFMHKVSLRIILRKENLHFEHKPTFHEYGFTRYTL